MLHFLSEELSGRFGHLIALCLMLAMFNMVETANERSQGANGVELFNKFVSAVLHCKSLHFWKHVLITQEIHCAMLIGVTIHDANVYEFLVLDNLSHTQYATGLRRPNKTLQQNTSGRKVIAAHHLD